MGACQRTRARVAISREEVRAQQTTSPRPGQARAFSLKSLQCLEEYFCVLLTPADKAGVPSVPVAEESQE